MFQTTAPYQQYFDTDGSPLDSGYLYFGISNLNPETSPVAIYWDAAGTQPAPQPIRTLNGYAVRSGTPALIYTAGDYSVSIKNSKGVLIAYSPTPSGFLSALANQTDPAQGASLVGYKLNATGSVGRTVYSKLTDFVSVKDFGAVGDGVTNDTAAIQAAITYVQTAKRRLYVPGGTYIVTGPISVSASGVEIFGDGAYSAILKASGNFASILNMTAAAAYVTVENLSFLTGTTTTKCATLAVNCVVIRFSNCYFEGDLNGDLVYSNGQNLDLDRCTFQMNSGTTYGLNLDCYNQNTGVTNCRFGGVGRGVRVTNALTPGSNRVEGLKIVGSYFINTGTTNLEIGTSLFTTLDGTAFDQCTSFAVDIQAGADNVVIDGCYLGSSAVTTAIGVNIAATAGHGHVISNNIFGFLGFGVNANATAGNRVSQLSIVGNAFTAVVTPLLLDSVDQCLIESNNDTGTPVNGSWGTKGTFAGGGSYNFMGNNWYTATPALYHAASTYRFGNDIGLKGRNKGKNTAVSATSLVINHGLFTTPSKIVATPAANTGTFFINTITTTQFTVTWATNTSVDWHWDAEV